MAIKRIYVAAIAGIALLAGLRCRQPYILPVNSTNNHYLVVEGIINTGDGLTTIKLSRNVRLSDSVNTKPELNATVSIESDATPEGTSLGQLTDNGNGTYTIIASGISPANKYRLRIVTSTGKVYLSDFVPVKNSPPIDSLSFQVMSNGVQVYSATHDPANNTRYYRWDYSETWIVHSDYESIYEAVTTPTDTIINRPAKDQIYTCYTSAASTSIVLNSSAKIAQDVIVHNPVVFVGSTSEKLKTEYSVTVTQYALTADAFNYWQLLKKNTELLGSIFDAQPSQIGGNIHSVDNPSELVIGYISAGASTQKILFIGNSSTPQVWTRTIPSPYNDCVIDSLYYVGPITHKNDVAALYAGGEIPILPIVDPHEIIVGFAVSSDYCVDCRFRGTNVRPAFWIDKR
jgi:hypothetical protein